MTEQKAKSGALFRTAGITAIILVVLLQTLAMDVSIVTLEAAAARPVFATLISFCVVLSLNLVLFVLLGRVGWALSLGSVLVSFSAIANRYIYELHAAPLRASELANLTTAADVASGFQLYLAERVPVILALLAACLILSIVTARRFLHGVRPAGVRLLSAAALALSAGVVFSAFCSDQTRPQLGFSWEYAAQMYGYPACLLEDTLQFISCTVEPEQYSVETLQALTERAAPTEARTREQLPDIVLILNETFYDPKCFPEMNLKTDRDYLEHYHAMESTARGNAIIPVGGTNCSEYELLTSNSSTLINPSAPFNFLPLADANSVVRYLKALGYETWAMHHMSGENYSRASGYPELGFDHVVFEENFEYDAPYGKRDHTDAADYLQLIDAYEASHAGPRLLYLLTYQNHGGWEQNDVSFDTIHSLTDYGDLTDDMDEFLSSISLSDAAFQDLTEYFAESARHVIVVMVGDHAAAFVNERFGEYMDLDDADEGSVQKAMRLSTPFVIWSNYRELPSVGEYVSMVDLVPLALRFGGVPLSPYYQTILNLQRTMPIRIFSLAADEAGNILVHSDTPIGQNPMRKYFYMEYNNLSDGEERLQRLFDPK